MTRGVATIALVVAMLLFSLVAGGCGDGESGESATTATVPVASTAAQPTTTSAPDTTSPTAPPAPTTTSAVAARPAPDFAGTTIDGTAVSLASFKGKPLLLVFWASW